MSTLDTDKVLKNGLGELYFAAFCMAFGAIYESFSFGVYSNYMIYAFIVPFAAGLLFVVMHKHKKEVPSRFVILLHMTSVTAALGFIATGVVNIYGSDNRLLVAYPILGATLFAASLISYIVPAGLRKNGEGITHNEE